MNIFWNAGEGRLRTLWRLLLQVVFMAVLGLAPALAVGKSLGALHRRGLFLPGLGQESFNAVVNMIVGPMLTVGIICSVALAGRWLDRRPWREFRPQLDKSGWAGLGLGFGISALVMALLFAVESMAGWVNVTGTAVVNAAGMSLGLGLGLCLVKALCVGTYEEFLSRGYHLRNLIDGVGLSGALVISSAVFALLHLVNDNASVLSTLGLFVNALFFASAVLATGRLTTAIGAHIGWNLFEGTVFGFPVSGDKEPASLIGLQQHGPELWTGGDFGPEAGLLGILASLLGIGIMVALASRRRRAQH
jgi:membrane protease YdiL (CAAX protease family)